MINLTQYRIRNAFLRQRAAFFSDVAVVLRQGVKLQDCLRLKINFNRGKPLGRAFTEIMSRLSEGAKLSDAFKPLLPDTEAQALQGWDEAKSDMVIADGFSVIGTLANAFEQIQAEIRKTLMKSVSALGLMFFIFWMMTSSIYPSIIANFPVIKWGFIARLFYFGLNLMFANIYLLIALLATAGIGYAWSLRNWRSSLRCRLDNTILYSWWRSYRSLSVLLSLALNLKSNPSINGALRKASQNAGRWEYGYLQEMLRNNSEGKKGGEVFNVGFFDTPIMERILMLSSTGSAEQAMETIAFTTQKELLDGFRQRIEGYGNLIKVLAMAGGATPVCLFFITVGDYIINVVGVRG